MHERGPLLIVAGAGAGKTRVIVHRIVHLIESGVPAENILAVTFTNKAAGEMRSRIKISGPFVSTFHSLGVYILRENARAVGTNKFFTILDKEDSLSLTKQAMRDSNVDPKIVEPKKILSAISRSKGDLITLDDYLSQAVHPFHKTVGQVWRRYEELKRKQDSFDFDDLILEVVRLFQTRPEILKSYQERWKYVHVDEYQDTNVAQYELTRLLTSSRKNLCVVGDSDQSIYGWRGANFKNILNFKDDYPDARVVVLEENYRSTQNILHLANEIIKKNKLRHEKNLFTKNPQGEQIGLYEAADENDEAIFTAGEAMQLIQNGAKPHEIAVLYRANFQSRVLEQAFLALSIPYQVLGTQFFERREVKDVLAYARLALNDADVEALKRVINVPARGIGKVTLLKIVAGQENELPESMKTKLRDFREIILNIKNQISNIENKSSEIVKLIMHASGIERALRVSKTEEDLERLENIKELVTLATKYDDLPAEEGVTKLIEEATLVSDQDALKHKDKKETVKLMTVHAAKGLEFDNVFVTGLEDGLFPHAGLAFDDEYDENERQEEERRLFYVAVTRARRKLYLSFAATRTIFGDRRATLPSQFLSDIPPHLLESSNPSPNLSPVDLEYPPRV